MLKRLRADLLPNEKENTLTVRIHRMACPALNKAISSSLADLTKAAFHHPQTGARNPAIAETSRPLAIAARAT